MDTIENDERNLNAELRNSGSEFVNSLRDLQ